MYAGVSRRENPGHSPAPTFERMHQAANRLVSGYVSRRTGMKVPSTPLDGLLAGIMERNVHAEQDFGPPEGEEIW